MQGTVDAAVTESVIHADVASIYNAMPTESNLNTAVPGVLNTFSDVDVGQWSGEVNAGLNLSSVDFGWADDLAAGLPSGSPAAWQHDLFEYLD